MNTEELLKRGLAQRAVGASDGLLELIVREAVAVPQRRALPWHPPAGSRRLLAFALLALLVAALAGAIAIGFRPPRPHTALVPHANGEIVTQGDGCALVAIDPGAGTTRPVFAGVPACFPPVSQYELTWDPTGTRLAFIYSFVCGGCASNEAKAAMAAGVGGLWVLDPATSHLEQLVTCSTCSLQEPSWSPDGSRIAYSRWDGQASNWQIWVVPSSGGAATRVSDGQSVYGHPAWSPDSRQVAYLDESGGRPGVILSDADGTARSVLFETSGQTIEGIAWSPDNQSILVMSNASGGGTIRIVRADGSGSSIAVSLSDGTRPLAARWSPDGSRIAFERTTETTDPQAPVTLTRAEVWVMAADGSHRQLLFQAPSPLSAMSDVGWSPDNRYVSFSVVADSRSTSRAIYLAAADGSGVRNLRSVSVNLPGVPSIAWQPLPVKPMASP